MFACHHVAHKICIVMLKEVLSIIVAKSVIIYTLNNNEVQHLPQKQIFLVADTIAGWCGEHFSAYLVHTPHSMGKGNSSTTTWLLHLTLTLRYSL